MAKKRVVVGMAIWRVGGRGAFQVVNVCSSHQARWAMPVRGWPGRASPENRQVAMARGAKARLIIRPLKANSSHNRQARG